MLRSPQEAVQMTKDMLLDETHQVPEGHDDLSMALPHLIQAENKAFAFVKIDHEVLLTTPYSRI